MSTNRSDTHIRVNACRADFACTEVKEKKQQKKKASTGGGKRGTLGRILPVGRRPPEIVEPPTRTTKNPLAQVPLRQSMGPPPSMDPLVPPPTPSSSLVPGGVGAGSGGIGSVDPAHPSKLHKSASVTQLDLLMSEMKNNPRAMIHLAPRLEHTMQRLNHTDREEERARRKKEKNNHRRSKTGFKRSISLKVRGEKHGEKDRTGGADRKGKGKETQESSADDPSDAQQKPSSALQPYPSPPPSPVSRSPLASSTSTTIQPPPSSSPPSKSHLKSRRKASVSMSEGSSQGPNERRKGKTSEHVHLSSS